MIFNIDYRKGEQRNTIHKQRIISKLRDSSAGSLQMRQHLETEESSRVHNHEVRSSILRPATRKHSKIAVFFSYIDRQATPKGAGPWRSRTRELALVGRKRQGTGRTRSDHGLTVPQHKTAQGFPTRLSWVPCERT